jgi:hypothetical protein
MMSSGETHTETVTDTAGDLQRGLRLEWSCLSLAVLTLLFLFLL